MQRLFLPAACSVGLVSLAFTSSTPVQPLTAAPTPQQPQEPVEVLLDNGFRMVVVEDPRVPRVAASLWYRVGALQEQLGEHGSTHFLEHAVHQGTMTIGIRDAALDRRLQQEIWDTEQQLIAERSAQRNQLRERRVFFDELEWPSTPRMDELRRRLYQLEDRQGENREFWAEYNWYRRNGAIYPHTDPVPATTGNEHLDIEVDLPKERIELFFRIEADRMVNAVLRGWEAQRFTVLEQNIGRYNPPERARFSEAMYGVTGTSHPTMLDPAGHWRDYGTYDRASMLRMYDDYFVPNNVTLVLVGDITPAEARRLGQQYFGQIPRGNPPWKMDVEAETPPGGSVRLDWLEPLEPRVVVRHRIPGVGHPDRAYFDVIARVLAGSEGMVAAAVAAQPNRINASASASAGRSGPSWPLGSPTVMDVQASAPRDEDLPAVEQAIITAIEQLKAGRIDQARLARLHKEMRLDYELVRADRRSFAAQLGRFSTADSWQAFQQTSNVRMTAAPADLQRIAQRYLVPWNRVTGVTRRNPPATATGNLKATVDGGR